MSFDIRNEGNVVVVSINETRLDASLAESFKGFLFNGIEKGAAIFLIDLTHVCFMDSSGLGVLVAALKKLPDGGSIRLASAQPAVKDLLELTSMEKLFAIFPSVSSALGSDE